jgi:hypothetical protein
MGSQVQYTYKRLPTQSFRLKFAHNLMGGAMYVGGEFACCHVMNFKFAVQLVSLTTDALAFRLWTKIT